MLDFLRRLFGRKNEKEDINPESSLPPLSATPNMFYSVSNKRSARTSSVLSCEHSSSYVILDTETTGLSPVTDQIIQLSAIKYNPQGVPVDFYNTYLNPGCRIPQRITEINGITDQMVANAPFAAQIRDRFLDFVGDSLIVGYNVTFDLRFLSCTFNGIFDGRHYMDALSLARQTLFMPNYKLETVASEIGFHPDGTFHDAFTDCEAVAAILHHIGIPFHEFIKEFRRPEPRIQSKDISPSWSDRPQVDEGYEYWLKGETLRKNGELPEALRLFNQAKEAGYDCPVIYQSYAMLYRKQGEYEKEISILEEGIRRYPGDIADGFKYRISRAKEKLISQQQREAELQQKAIERSRKEEERRKKKETESARPKKALGRPVVQCLDDGTVVKKYDSIASASKGTGVSTKCIRDTANGKQKHAGGFCWRFLDSNSDEEISC